MKCILYFCLIWICYANTDVKKTKYKLPDYLTDRAHRVGGVLSTGKVVKTLSATGLKEYTAYYTDVVQKFIYALEEYDFSQLPFENFSHNISKQYYTLNVTGKLDFTNGFIVSIGRILLPEDVKYILDDTGLTAKVFTTVVCEDILTMNDFYAVLADKQFGGTVLLKYPNIYYELSVIKDLTTGDIKATTSYLSNMYPSWEFDPVNEYTDAFKNEIIRSKITNKLKESFDDWSIGDFQKLWPKVLQSVPFPDICNYCFT